jgi:hypothetical protein
VVTKYIIKEGAIPEQSVVFTSVDETGGIGQLSSYVMANCGIKVKPPTQEELSKGFHIAKEGQRELVFIVSVTSEMTTKNALHTNLNKAIASLSSTLEGKSIWLPLMGTGSGRLSYSQSALVIKEIIKAYQYLEFGRIVISTPNTLDINELRALENLFNPPLSISPAPPKSINKLIKAFLYTFPLEKLPELKLEEYTNIDYHDYFTYWIEHKTAAVGGVKGGSSFKFGIFKRKNKEEKKYSKGISYSKDYAWYTRYGDNEAEAYQNILSLIVKVANYSAQGKIHELKEIQLDNRIKWKIAFLYQDFSQPKITSIYKKEALMALSGLSKAQFNIARAHEILINKKPENTDIWTYSMELWDFWSKDNKEVKIENTIGIQKPLEISAKTTESISSSINPEIEIEDIDEEEQELELESEGEINSNITQITAFDNDCLTGENKLGISREIEALASVIAYKKTLPPLSIGIFGEWGAGKSFYMEQLKKEVSRLASKTKKTNKLQRDSPFYKEIVQISFNAWNYVESDLWASLAQNIYQKLYEKHEENAENDAYWLGILKYGEEQAKEKKEEITRLEEDVEKVSSEIDELNKQEDKAEKCIDSHDVHQIFTEAIPENIKSECHDLFTELGGTSTFDTLRQTLNFVENIKESSLWFHALKNTRKRVIAGYVAIPLLLILASYLIANNLFPAQQTISNIITSLLTVGTSVGLWLKNKASTISNWIIKLEQLRSKVTEHKSQKLDDFNKEKEDLMKSLEQVINDLKRANEEKKSLEKSINEAKKNLNELTPESILNDHVTQTIGDNRYGKYLGLPALLSKDFKTLSKVISKLNEELEDPKKFKDIKDESNSDSTHRINRIVLYIDDLDRLPAATVIKVLQAVHLFLASPLFVIVLGVDPRWLFSSIKEHYSELIIDDNQECASPEEYLEKIFQIPIWLQQPKPEEVQELMASVIGRAEVDNGQEIRKQVLVKTSEITESSTINLAPAEYITEKPQGNELAQKPLESSGSPQVKNTNIDDENNDEVELMLLAEHHELKQFEINFIHQLSPILARSPRAVKRYLNLYRLIKSSISKEKEKSFISSNTDAAQGYKTVAFLLAIVVGWPKISKPLFRELKFMNKPEYIFVLVDQVRIKYIENSDSIPIENKSILIEFITIMEGAEISKVELAPISHWINIVARYSYNKLQNC